MTGNFIKPPSMGEGGPVQLSRIYEATGLPSEYLTAEFVRAHVIPCVAETFSDGEVVVQHPTEEDPVVREHFGTRSYDEGAFGQRLRELFEGDDLGMRHQVDGLIRFSANVFAHDVAWGNIQLPSAPNVALDTQHGMIGFDRHAVALARPPQTVVDYGPGLQGRFYIDRQLADLQAGRPPYAYLPVTKGPFANEFLMQYWAARLGDDPNKVSQVMGRIYIGREDGIAAATDYFAEAQAAHTGTSEMADIVVASGIHAAGYDEVSTGIANAHKLLKPDGTLLVRAPKSVRNERPGSVSAEAMVEMALAAGFDMNRAQFFDVTTGGTGISPLTESLSVVFRK